VRDNDISGMRDGLYLSYARETLVDTNRIHDLRYALHAMFGADLMVFGNTIERNASGLVLMNTAGVEASRNVITDHRSDATGYGILLKDVRSVRLVENTIARDQVGIRAEGVDRTQALADVLLNDIAHNVVGAQLFPTAMLVFSRNSFIGNVVNVDTPGAARANGSEWTKSGAGNYWSGYAGYDLNGDQLGDVPHVEGSSAERLVTTAPELRILRSSVAFSILARAERWWNIGQAPRIIDRIPLVAPLVMPHAPAPALAPAAPRRSIADNAAWIVTGLALLAALSATGRLRRAT
jgi:nitrous oxidase accessory protein